MESLLSSLLIEMLSSFAPIGDIMSSDVVLEESDNVVMVLSALHPYCMRLH